MRRPLILTLATVAAVLSARPATASWTRDITVNQPISVTTGDQLHPAMVPDGQGGFFIAWDDARSGDIDVYVQRLNPRGEPMWAANGIAITPAGTQTYPQIAADGVGGVIVVWTDFRSLVDFDLYAQRVNGLGQVQWAAGGVPVCTAVNNQWHLRVESDGFGGALATWTDFRNDPGDIYVQRIAPSGARLWTANGVGVGVVAGEQQLPDVAPDGTGGAYVAWDNFGPGSLRRVDAAGAIQWAGPVTLGLGSMEPRITPDGAGGVIAAWTQIALSGSEDGVWTQRYNALGNPQWFGDVWLMRNPGWVQNTIDRVEMCTDGAGGAIVVWSDRRNGSSNRDLFVRRVTAAGVRQWTNHGVPVCTATGNTERWHPIVPDGLGGAVITWHDPRFGGLRPFAQRVDMNGIPQWAADGQYLCNAAFEQSYPVIAPDTHGGYLVAWQDSRAGFDIYAQRIERYGHFGDPAPLLTQIKDLAADQGGRVRLRWNASYRDTLPTGNIELYGIWRRVTEPGLAAFAAGARVSEDGAPADARPGTYRAVPMGAQVTWWEGVGSIPGRAEPWYTFVAETFQDSTAAGNPYTAFMVDAHDAYGPAFWSSLTDSGYSVDNLPPPAPSPVTGSHNGSAMQMAWGASDANDLAGYSIYRGPDADFVPSPANRIATTSGLAWSDPAPFGSWYKLVAVDVHGNVSDVRVIPPGGVNAVEPERTSFALAPPSPNPAHGALRIAFSLARPGAATLDVHDAAGRRVRRLLSMERPAGEASAIWDLRDDAGQAVAGGLYFVRLVSGGETRVRRIVTIH